MTPFHNALLMCAVANEGTLMKPYVVDHVEGADGTTVKETIPEIYADLMSEKDAKKLQKMLREVVTSGTGYNLDTDLYTAAGKTGKHIRSLAVYRQRLQFKHRAHQPVETPRVASRSGRKCGEEIGRAHV